MHVILIVVLILILLHQAFSGQGWQGGKRKGKNVKGKAGETFQSIFNCLAVRIRNKALKKSQCGVPTQALRTEDSHITQGLCSLWQVERTCLQVTWTILGCYICSSASRIHCISCAELNTFLNLYEHHLSHSLCGTIGRNQAQ